MSPVFIMILGAYAMNDAGLPGIVCDFEAVPFEIKCGRVLVVTQASITIIDENNQESTDPFHLRLANRQVIRTVDDGKAWLPSDVRVGGIVYMDCVKVSNEKYCIAIQIFWRPGGKIPPSQKPDDWQPAHEVLQAMGEARRFKTPLPRYLRGAKANSWDYPAFNPRIEKSTRLKRFPYDDPWTYMEYTIFMR